MGRIRFLELPAVTTAGNAIGEILPPNVIYKEKRFNGRTNLDIGVAPLTQLCTGLIKIVTFKGSHLVW